MPCSAPMANVKNSPDLLLPPKNSRASARKYSLPPSLSAYGERRKLSHRLSIGWRSSHQQVVEQARSLCGRYLRHRLRACCPALQRKLGLQRLKSVSHLGGGGGGGDLVPAVAAELRALSAHLEAAHPRLFASAAANLGQQLSTEAAVHGTFTALAREIAPPDHLTWGRVVALFAIAGALALDCARAGKPEYALGLVQSMGLFVESDLAAWICQQGGWATLLTRFKEESHPNHAKEALALLFVAFLAFLGIYWFLS